MSSMCCDRSASLSSKLNDVIDLRLESLLGAILENGNILGGPLVLCNSRFEIAAAVNVPNSPKKDSDIASLKPEKNNMNLRADSAPIVQALGALRLAASRFATTLQVIDMPALHIKGDTHIFSCYSVGTDYYIAMYLGPMGGRGGVEVERFDTTQMDTFMEGKLDDLALYLHGLKIKRK